MSCGNCVNKVPRFELGTVLITPGALACLEVCKTGPERLLRRHAIGDWGVLDEQDAQQNELAVANGMRVLSNYVMANGHRLWVVTEQDRSVTTILLPEEY